MKIQDYFPDDVFLYGKALASLDFSIFNEFMGKKVKVIDHNDLDILGTFNVIQDGFTTITTITNLELTIALLRDDLMFSDKIMIYSIQTENGVVLLRCSKDSFI